MAKLWRLTSRPMRATSTVIKRTPAQSGCFSGGFSNPECGWQRPICMSCMWARVDGSCFPCWWPIIFNNLSSIIFVGHYIYNIILYGIILLHFCSTKKPICVASPPRISLDFTDSHWFPIDFPLISHWFPIDFPLISHWFPIDFPLISHWFPIIFHFSSPLSQGARRHHCPASRCGAQPAGTGIDGGHGADSDALRGAETGDLATGGFTVEIPSGYVKIAIENDHLSWIFPLRMVIFHSYVSLPEGI